MDPYFDAVTAELRGFDLGDDDELLGGLVRRRAQAADAMEHSEWMLLGVLLQRATMLDEAFGCFEKACSLSDDVTLPRYLQAQLCLDRGQPDEAEALLDLAEESNEQNGPVPAAELLHARGSVALVRGDAEEALTLYAGGLREDGNNWPRWLDLANLCRVLGRYDDAFDAAMQATQLGPDVEPTHYTLACAAALTGRYEQTLESLATSFSLDPSRRPSAQVEPAFEAFIDEAAFMALFEEATEPDLSWMDRFPSWLQLLRADPVLQTAGVQWLDAAQSEEATAGLSASYTRRGPVGVLHTDATLELSRKLLIGKRVVARGPDSTSREGVAEPSWLIVDESAPNTLWVALSIAYPPFLWLDAGTEPYSLHEALGEYFPRPHRDRASLLGRARGFMGYRKRFGVANPYTDDVVPADEQALDNHFTLCPFVEAGSWGGAYADDPWPDDVPTQPNSATLFGQRQREVSRQATGAVWSRTRRTRHSRSYVGVELHHQELFILDVRYAPSQQRDVIERMNAHFGCDYPIDMPVDVVATLLGFGFDSAEDLQNELETTAKPEELAGLLSLLSAMLHSDLRVTWLYRRYMDHPNSLVRTTLWNVFAAYNYESLLEEALLLETDPDVQKQLDTLLNQGIPAIEHEEEDEPQRALPPASAPNDPTQTEAS